MLEQLGAYQIVNQIGKGGMGTVYKAYHAALDRHVAIKVLPARLSADPNFVERFKKEAQIIARLEHPHILPVYDFAFEGDIAYLVMKLVEGSSLTRSIGPRGMTTEKALPILQAVSQALEHAHRRNIVHRDLKPDNILIGEGEWVYLSDFGMAKILTNPSPTAKGMVMGTPEYMAPEQAQGKAIDHRADVYSLSVLIYHMLTGYVPFKGDHPLATIYKVINEPFPAITDKQPNLPRLLNDLLKKGAAKEPRDRFSQVSELMKMLETVVSSSTMAGIEEQTTRHHRVVIVPFSTEEPDKAWLGNATPEMLGYELSQSPELYVLSGDLVARIRRNLPEHDSNWNATPLQRFFELSNADYVVLGKATSGQIHYEMKISTTFDTVDKGVAEGTIPFHLVSMIAQKIRNKIGVKNLQIRSVEQIFHGNVGLLQNYSMGVRKFREGKWLDAERYLRLALQQESAFAPAHLYLARTLMSRGLQLQAEQEAQLASNYSASLPITEATLVKAQYLSLVHRHKEAAEIYKHFHTLFPDVTEYLVLWGEALVRGDFLDDAANVFYKICEKEEKTGLGWQRLAWIEFLQEKYEQAWYHYKRAERLYRQSDLVGGQASTSMGLAEVSVNREEWNTAIEYYRRAEELFASLGWEKGIADAKYHLALALKNQHAHKEAQSLLKQSAESYRETGDLAGEYDCAVALIQEHGNSDEALQLCDRALEIAVEMHDSRRISSVIPLKLKLYVELSQYDAALELYSTHFNTLLQNSPMRDFPLSQIQITRALLKQLRFEEAEQQVDQALRILSKNKELRPLALGMLTRAEYFLMKKDVNAARQYVEEAERIIEGLSEKELELEINLMKAKLLKEEQQNVQLLEVYMHSMKLAEDLGRHTLVRQLKNDIQQLR